MNFSNSTQFTVTENDIRPLPVTMPSESAIIACILAVSKEHPGFLQWLFRQIALADSNFIMKSSCSNPAESVKAQDSIFEWMTWFDEELNKDQHQGGDYDAEKGS